MSFKPRFERGERKNINTLGGGGGGGERREIASRKSQKSEEKKGQESASLRGLPKVSQGLTQLTF